MRKTRSVICVLMAAMMVLSGCQSGGSDARENTTKEEERREDDENGLEEKGQKEEGSKQENEDNLKEEAGDDLPEEEDKIRPITIDISAEYISEWEDGQQIIQGSSSKLHILDEGYDAFQAILDEYGEANWREVQEVYQEYLPEAMERFAGGGYAGYEISRTIDLDRADSRIVSFTDGESSYLGGAHGSYYLYGVNFDPLTGKRLSLEDVAEDYDKVYEYTKEYLVREYGEEAFFEDYQDTLKDMFYGSGEGLSALQWTMDTKTMFLYFSQYVLGPYASGAFIVEIPFVADEQQMVKKEYASGVKGSAKEIWEWTENPVDVNGESRILSYTIEKNEINYNSMISIRWGQQSAELEMYGSFLKAYLFQKEDGRVWLYADCLGDNDWHTMYVFDLNQDIPVCVGDTTDYIGKHLVADPEDFVLYTHMEALGTYIGLRHYRVGENGMPEVIDGVYTIINYDRGWGEYAITSKVELPVQMHGGDGTEKTQEMVPPGTVFYLRRTDGETFVEMELEDKRRCDILIEKDGYFSRVNGMSEDDCFDGLRYAG